MQRKDPERESPDFTEFVASCSPRLYRQAWLLTTSTHAAEDLVQQALTKAYASWRRVSRADDPVAYVHRIVIREFLTERRRRRSTELPVERTPDRAVQDPDPALRADLVAALRQLSPLDRAVVVLRHWEDNDVAATAALLGLSQAAVKNRSMRALAKLRHLLEPTETNGPDTRSTGMRSRA